MCRTNKLLTSRGEKNKIHSPLSLQKFHTSQSRADQFVIPLAELFAESSSVPMRSHNKGCIAAFLDKEMPMGKMSILSSSDSSVPAEADEITVNVQAQGANWIGVKICQSLAVLSRFYMANQSCKEDITRLDCIDMLKRYIVFKRE